MARTIESPGIEIREIDLSLRASLPVGTNVFVQGFADSGPTDELINVTSLTEYEQIYGLPTNASERYMFHTAKQVLQSPGNLLTNRLPYGLSGGGGYSSEYSALLYPVTITNTGVASASNDTTTYSTGTSYAIGEPVQFVLTEDQYLSWESGQLDWTDTPNASAIGSISAYNSIGNAGIIVVNEIKTTIDNNYGGYYLGIHDNTSLTDTIYDSVTAVEYNGNDTVSDWNTVPTTMIETALTGTEITDSVSEDLETAGSYDITTSDNDDTIIMALYRFRQSTTSFEGGVALQGIRREAYVGSLDASRMYAPEGQAETFFISNMVNADSVFMKTYINPNLASQGSWIPGGVRKQVRSALKEVYAIGPQLDPTSASTKYIGNMPEKISRSLRLAENKEQIPIDIVCDGGLSTIWTKVYTDTGVTDGNSAQNYDDTEYQEGIFEAPTSWVSTNYLADQTDGASSDVQQSWSVVYNRLNQFCSETRKDCLFISDPVKGIFVQGNLKTLQDTSKNFSSDVYWPLKNLFGASNSNYACTYANWAKVYDDALGAHTWIPFSGYEANIMCKMDAALQPWYAPAGLNNGLVTDLSDIALNPTQKQRDLLYRISMNPVVFFPGDGYTVWGQKTLQKKPSAFDRINVRRLFLVLEKATNAVMRYFVFEPNTVFTRTRVVNILSPIFDIAKNNEGVYDYLIVCDERNNTPQVIDNNELVVDIYLKPVRTAEFILINFYATRTDQDFTELI